MFGNREMRVVGEDDEFDYVQGYGPGIGDVMGDVMGYEEVGRAARKPARGAVIAVKKPNWRGNQLAPGVHTPDEGLVPISLNGPGGGNVFSATNQAITFSGFAQKPFLAERLLLRVVRTGTTAVGSLVARLFAGTDLMQADINPLDLELIGQVNGFGLRMSMKPVQPGVLIQFPTTLTTALTTTDTIAVSMMLLGRIVH